MDTEYAEIRTSQNWVARVAKPANIDIGYADILTGYNWVAMVAKVAYVDISLYRDTGTFTLGGKSCTGTEYLYRVTQRYRQLRTGQLMVE